MACSTLVSSRMAGTTTLPQGRNRCNSYLEKLTDISNDLDFFRQNQQSPFMSRGSPATPLSATKTVSFVFEVNAKPSFGSSQTAQQHYKQLGWNGSQTLPQQSPYFNQLDSHSGTDYKAVTTGIQSLPINSPQPVTTKNIVLPTSSLSPVTSPTSPKYITSERSWNAKVAVMIPERKLELSPMTRILHTRPIWYLPNRQRAAVAHYLQPYPVGTFVVRQGRQKHLVLTMKHPGTIPYIQNYPLHTTSSGKLKWEKSNEEFDKIEDLINYHMLVEERLPCRLILPEAIMNAKNVRELQSLAVLEEEFWDQGHHRTPLSPVSTSSTSVSTSPTSPAMPQPNSPYHALPVYKQCQKNAVTDHQRRSPYYTSIVSPTLPILVGDEYANMPTSPKLLSPVLPLPTTSQATFQSNQGAVEQTGTYQGGSFANQLKSERISSLESTPSSRLSVPVERQPMRYSTQSEQDSLMMDTGKRYPPPMSSPPPPPPPPTTTKDQIRVSAQTGGGHLRLSSGSCAFSNRRSKTYYTPHETTRQEHKQIFSSQIPVTPALPAKSKPTNRILTTYTPYQLPSASENIKPAPIVYSDSEHLAPVSAGYSCPLSQEQLSSKDSQETNDTHKHLDVCPLEPTKVLGASAPKENPLRLFDPLLLSESRMVQESLPVEHIPSVTLKSDCLNTNTNSHSVINPNSNNHGANKPVVLTGNLITLYDEEVDPLSELPESEESTFYLEEEIKQGDEVTAEKESERGSILASGSDLNSSQEMSSGSSNVITESQGLEKNIPKLNEVENLKKKYRKTRIATVRKTFTKFVKKKTNQLEQKTSRNFKVVTVRKTFKKSKDPARDIRAAIDRLSFNLDSPFSALLGQFIQNVREKGEVEKPDVMMRNVRQFMSGIKNFLFNRQVPEVDAVMDKYSDLSLTELDAIVEGTLHLYILKPLKDDIYQCFINELKRNGALALLDHNIQTAKSRSMQELGIKGFNIIHIRLEELRYIGKNKMFILATPNYVPPTAEIISEIKALINGMEEVYSPIKKLDYLLQVVTSVYTSVVDKKSGRAVAQSMGADDFLPMLIYVLVQCEAVHIEVEADYMWGLLEPSKLSGEGGYYLTTLSSAICVLKQFEEDTQSDTKGFLTVIVAAETNGLIEFIDKTLPVLPGMTAADICRIISHKMQIENAEDDYQLYLISNEEVPLVASCCPMYVKTDIEASEGKTVRFGYKLRKQQVEWPPPIEE